MGRLVAGLMAVAALVGAAEPGGVTIVDSGSTNRAGFRIVVERSGRARLTRARKGDRAVVRRTLAAGEAERLFADLAAAGPISSLREVHCLKSASFGSRLTLRSEGAESPDLSCGDAADAALGHLVRDVQAIVAQFQTR